MRNPIPSPAPVHRLELRWLPPAASDELARASSPGHFRDGALVFAQGDSLPGVYVVARGALRLFSVDARGRRIQVLEVLGPGECAGGLQIMGGGVAATHAEAVGETLCWIIPAEAMRLMALGDNGVAICMLRHFSGTVRRLLSLVEVLSLQSVPERVGTLVLDQVPQARVRLLVEFRESQDELAQRIGTCREGFCRALRQMADLGLIQNTFPVVRILDLERLKRFSRGICLEPARRLSC